MVFTKTVQLRTFAKCTHIIVALKLWERLWRFKTDQNIEVCRRLERVTKKIVHSAKREQNLQNTVKKSSKTWQVEKTVISVSA